MQIQKDEGICNRCKHMSMFYTMCGLDPIASSLLRLRYDSNTGESEMAKENFYHHLMNEGRFAPEECPYLLELMAESYTRRLNEKSYQHSS